MILINIRLDDINPSFVKIGQSRFKGDSISQSFKIDQVITNWKIRTEIFDKDGASYQMANIAAGGSNSQIEITNGALGLFTVKIPKDTTDNFDKQSYLEVEMEDNASTTNKYTVFRGEISLLDQQINWTTPS